MIGGLQRFILIFGLDHSLTLDAVTGAVMLVAGIAWIGMLTWPNVAARLASLAWAKARALVVYLFVVQEQ
jgi:hypothetical protein